MKVQKRNQCMGTSKLDKKLMVKLRCAPGCTVHDFGKGEISCLEIEYESPAFKMWKDHYLPGGQEACELDESDPVYTPYPPVVTAAGLAVPLAAIGAIFQEVLNALITYAPLREEHFSALAPIPSIPLTPMEAPALGVKFHHSTIAAYKVLERIQSGDGLPNIAALAPNTAITRLNIIYSNCALHLMLHKQ
jgi:hypothetical protein